MNRIASAILAVLVAVALLSCSKRDAQRDATKPRAAESAAKPGGGQRKIKYYKSTMMLGEISQTPRKDSMGMEMVPVYEGEDETSAISVDPVTVQKMGVRTALVTRGPL